MTSNVAWNTRVRAWEGVVALPPFQQLASRVIAEAHLVPSDVVVDLGAGTGLLALDIAPRVDSVVAVDSSAPMLARLEHHARTRRLTNVGALECDLRDLALPDEYASLVVSSYAFHHLDTSGKELALAEARRVLRPGGRLVICDMMFGLSFAHRDRTIVLQKVALLARRGPSGLLRLARNGARAATGRWEHPSSPDAWRAMLEQRTFEHVRVEPVMNEAAIASARRPFLPGRTHDDDR